MKIVRFRADGKTRYGVLEGTHVTEYAGTPFGAFERGRKDGQWTRGKSFDRIEVRIEGIGSLRNSVVRL